MNPAMILQVLKAIYALTGHQKNVPPVIALDAMSTPESEMLA